MMIAMTPKQKRFVEHYVASGNATDAAKQAGYSEHTAAIIGHENLRKPKIASAIADEQAALSERTQITQDAVLERLWALGATAEADKAYGPAVSAYNLVGKHLGMFSDRVVVEHLRERAAAAAEEYDLDADEVQREAERWLAAKK